MRRAATGEPSTSECALDAPDAMPGSGSLDRLVETARRYARNAASENTLRAYAQDWAHFSRWTRRRGVPAFPPSPELVGLYIADCAAGGPDLPPASVATIERRLSGVVWACRQRGHALDRGDRAIASVLAGVRRTHGRPQIQKAALSAGEILAMTAALPFDLRGLRDRAMLLLGYAGGLRRSEIVGLDAARDDHSDGWAEILDGGVLLILRGKTGWREVEIGRGSAERSCPAHALRQWLDFSRIDAGPLFVRVSRDGRHALPSRLTDKHVARLVKRCAAAAGLQPDAPEADRTALFSAHSLRAGLATSAEIEERHVQKLLGHASAEMTRRYQRRRDRFRVNLTKAAGL